MLKQNRTDGTGWDWCWADWQRDWMDATPHRYAYRCLPLTIVNQTGWWIKNPVGFTATWRGQRSPGGIDFQFDTSAEVWASWINSQFGEGIITWNTPFLFRTKPEGSRLLICGPANYFKTNAHPLTALIESDWISMSFTMNWKIMMPNQPVRFELGEPLFQAIPLASNVCADLEDGIGLLPEAQRRSRAAPRLSGMGPGPPPVPRAEGARRGQAGRLAEGLLPGPRRRSAARPRPYHMTKVNPPNVKYTPHQPPGTEPEATHAPPSRSFVSPPRAETRAPRAAVRKLAVRKNRSAPGCIPIQRMHRRNSSKRDPCPGTAVPQRRNSP